MLIRRRFAAPNRTAFNPREILRRAFWAAMFLLHVGPALASWGSIGNSADVLAELLRSGFLLASAVFFVLKFVDVPWLRVKPGWRTSVASLIIIGLLHVGILDRATGGQMAYSHGHVGVVLIVSGLLGCDTVLRILAGLMKRRIVSVRLRAAPAVCRPTFVIGLLPPQWSLACRPCGPRAPPLA